MTQIPDAGVWRCVEGLTQPDWLDENGHVNVQYYFRLISEAAYEIMARILNGGAVLDPPPLYFTLDAHIYYRAELGADEDVIVTLRPLKRSAKVLTFLVRIWRGGSSAAPALSAECVWVVAYVDRESRRVVPPSEQAQSIFDRKLEEAASLEPFNQPDYKMGPPLPIPDPENEIVSFRGEISPDWIDRMGHMGIEHYMLIFDRAADGYFKAIGLTTEFLREGGWGAFAVGSHVEYQRELRAGEKFKVVTRAVSLQRKTLLYRHAILLDTKERIECATSDHTSVFVDWETRRSIEIPDPCRKRIVRPHGMSLADLGKP